MPLVRHSLASWCKSSIINSQFIDARGSTGTRYITLFLGKEEEIIRTWDDSELIYYVKTSKYFSEVIDKLGLSRSDDIYSHIRKHINRLKLDTSHFSRPNANRPKKSARKFEEYLVENAKQEQFCSSW